MTGPPALIGREALADWLGKRGDCTARGEAGTRPKLKDKKGGCGGEGGGERERERERMRIRMNPQKPHQQVSFFFYLSE